MPKCTHFGDLQNSPRQEDLTTIGELTTLFWLALSRVASFLRRLTPWIPPIKLEDDPNLIINLYISELLKYNRVETEIDFE